MLGLGVAFQQPGLFDGRSIAENLSLASPKPLSEQEVRQWLVRLGLESVSPSASPGTLSGGQQKRVALARALLRGQRLLVLDEPTSGLDPQSTAQITALLDELLADRPRSLLLITHNYAVAEALCDRVLLLQDGNLHELDNGVSIEAAIMGLAAEQNEQGSGRVGLESARRARSPGFWPALFDFLQRSFLLSALTMAVLGILLVVQSAGLSFIDISPEVPGVVVIGVFRELAPLVVGMLLASRIGAGISSEVAGMSYTSQLDAMRVLGISTTRSLLLPYAGAAAVAFPVNILLGAFAAFLAGGFIAEFPWSGLSIGTSRFYYLAEAALDPLLIWSCVLKGACMGTAVVFAAYFYGAGAIRSAPDLGRAVTRAAVVGSVLVVVIDIAISWIFFT